MKGEARPGQVGERRRRCVGFDDEVVQGCDRGHDEGGRGAELVGRQRHDAPGAVGDEAPLELGLLGIEDRQPGRRRQPAGADEGDVGAECRRGRAASAARRRRRWIGSILPPSMTTRAALPTREGLRDRRRIGHDRDVEVDRERLGDLQVGRAGVDHHDVCGWRPAAAAARPRARLASGADAIAARQRAGRRAPSAGLRHRRGGSGRRPRGRAGRGGSCPRRCRTRSRDRPRERGRRAGGDRGWRLGVRRAASAWAVVPLPSLMHDRARSCNIRHRGRAGCVSAGG